MFGLLTSYWCALGPNNGSDAHSPIYGRTEVSAASLCCADSGHSKTECEAQRDSGTVPLRTAFSLDNHRSHSRAENDDEALHDTFSRARQRVRELRSSYSPAALSAETRSRLLGIAARETRLVGLAGLPGIEQTAPILGI